MVIDKEKFAKVIHALCVEAGVDCEARCHQAPRAKRPAPTSSRRRNLTLAEAERMCRR
jgi:hypothetical protein